MSNPNPLYDIQEELLNYLRSRQIFADSNIHWITRREGQLLNDIDAGRAELRLAAFVYPPLPGDANPNIPGPRFQASTLRITWFENWEMNADAAVHTDRYAIETHRELHQVQLTTVEGLGLITTQVESPLEWSLTKQGLHQWDCWFTAPINLLPRAC